MHRGELLASRRASGFFIAADPRGFSERRRDVNYSGTSRQGLGLSDSRKSNVAALDRYIWKTGRDPCNNVRCCRRNFLIVAGLPRLVRWMPWVLVGMILAGVSVPLFGLEASGIKTIGAVPGGLPALGIPYDGIDNMPSLLADAAGSARRDRNIDNSRIGDGS